MKDEMLLTLTERGNGLPNVGELVYDADSDTVYKLTRDHNGGRIETNGPGNGNSCQMFAVELGYACDVTEEEWEAIADVGVSA